MKSYFLFLFLFFYQEKERDLDAKNIYANRLAKASKKDSDGGTKRKSKM